MNVKLIAILLLFKNVVVLLKRRASRLRGVIGDAAALVRILMRPPHRDTGQLAGGSERARPSQAGNRAVDFMNIIA